MTGGLMKTGKSPSGTNKKEHAIPFAVDPISSTMSRNQALHWGESAAYQFLVHMHCDGTFPVDPCRFARQLGVTVWMSVLPHCVPGMIHKTANQPAELFIDGAASVTSRRFSIAHQLGHMLAHGWTTPESEGSRMHRSEYRTIEEVAVDAYAGALLMPSSDMRVDARQPHSNRFDDLLSTRRYGVSEGAVIARKQYLQALYRAPTWQRVLGLASR